MQDDIFLLNFEQLLWGFKAPKCEDVGVYTKFVESVSLNNVSNIN